MTRKDFELIAKSLNTTLNAARKQRDSGVLDNGDAIVNGVTATIEDLARALTSTNPRFDWARFIAAATKE